MVTTTSILMLAIADSLEEGVVKSSDPELGKIIKRNYLVRPGSTMSGENKLKLKPVKDDLDAYRRLRFRRAADREIHSNGELPIKPAPEFGQVWELKYPRFCSVWVNGKIFDHAEEV